jgi:hypothetical protein
MHVLHLAEKFSQEWYMLEIHKQRIAAKRQEKSAGAVQRSYALFHYSSWFNRDSLSRCGSPEDGVTYE